MKSCTVVHLNNVKVTIEKHTAVAVHSLSVEDLWHVISRENTTVNDSDRVLLCMRDTRIEIT
jgi:hypothetical protein